MFVDLVIMSTTPKVWKDKKAVQVGDRVGVGTQIASCYERRLCMNDNEG
jgi:alcohol dehydrogenase (NADP+)